MIKMFKNLKEVKESRLAHLKENDFQSFVNETGLSRSEIDRIYKIFDERGF
jgi:hypothetical protein